MMKKRQGSRYVLAAVSLVIILLFTCAIFFIDNEEENKIVQKSPEKLQEHKLRQESRIVKTIGPNGEQIFYSYTAPPSLFQQEEPLANMTSEQQFFPDDVLIDQRLERPTSSGYIVVLREESVG